MAKEQRIEIVVVDDDDGHVELIRRNLRRAGILNPVVTLKDGESALDYVFCRGAYSGRSETTNLLMLLDINMPGRFNGMEVLRQIKESPNRRKLPVIMLTTTDDPREVNRCYELGCSIYITKPVEPVAFVEAITRLGLFISVVSVPTEEPSGK